MQTLQRHWDLPKAWTCSGTRELWYFHLQQFIQPFDVTCWLKLEPGEVQSCTSCVYTAICSSASICMRASMPCGGHSFGQITFNVLPEATSQLAAQQTHQASYKPPLALTSQAGIDLSSRAQDHCQRLLVLKCKARATQLLAAYAMGKPEISSAKPGDCTMVPATKHKGLGLAL